MDYKEVLNVLNTEGLVDERMVEDMRKLPEDDPDRRRQLIRQIARLPKHKFNDVLQALNLKRMSHFVQLLTGNIFVLTSVLTHLENALISIRDVIYVF